MSAAAAPRPRDTRRLVAAVMVAVFLAAIDQTIVATALPRISQELGDPALYAWVFTAYMMATIAFVPISGALGDIIGRRPVLLFGVAVFALGSALAGGASTMTALVVFRGLQGVGAGVLTANAFALLGDVYPAAALARATGTMSAVYGLAGAVGPLVGGLITDQIDWRWVFWINVGPCVAIGVVLFAALPRPDPSPRPPIDLLGAAALLAALIPGLAALTWAGEGGRLLEPRLVVALALTAAFTAAFVAIERRAARPILALELFRGATFTAAMIAMFGVALAMYASVSYAPLLFQERMGMSPTLAGAVTAPLVVALAVTASVAGRAIARGSGFKAPATAGVLIAAAGLGWLSTLEPASGPSAAAGAMAVVGAGIGLTVPTLQLAAQMAVPQRHFGVTTALAKFFRGVGGLVGVAAAGAVIRYHETNGEADAALSSAMLYAAAAMLAVAAATAALPARPGFELASTGEPGTKT